MSLFKTRTLNIKNYAAGTYTAGRWVPGASTPGTIKCTAQPANPLKVQALMEGKRAPRAYDIYTSDGSLQTADPTGQLKASEVEIDGEWYQVLSKAPWQNHIISHFEYVVIRDKEVGN